MFSGAEPARASEPAPVDRRAWPYRMKDLSELTGMPRQAIHFYIQQGLVPEGRKTGRNMAYYGEEHLERIRLVRQLQHERFLPLRAIRAMLEQRDDAFSPAQRRVLLDVKQRLDERIGAREGQARETVDATSLLARCGLAKSDLDEVVDAGLLAVTRSHGKLVVAKDDAWMLELFGEVRAAGFTKELGFPASVLTIYEEAMSKLVDRETKLLTGPLSKLPPATVASMIEKILPLIGMFLARYHDTKVRHFFASM
jgi:DNA-binding transcriptional MerR regulator